MMHTRVAAFLFKPLASHHHRIHRRLSQDLPSCRELNMNNSSQEEQLSIAQTLPVDVLCELFSTAASSDPPARKHNIFQYFIHHMRSSHRPNGEKGPLKPAWSKVPIRGSLRRAGSVNVTWPLAGEASLGWITLTHVCSHWRNVGLSQSSLWGDVFSVFPEVASTLLSRARDAPITLDMELVSFMLGPYSEDFHHFEILSRPHVASAGSITYSESPRDNWPLTLLSQSELPKLKDLRLAVAVYDSVFRKDFKMPSLRAPALERLVAENFLPFIAANLVYLELSRLYEPINDGPLLEALRMSPLLKELLLVWKLKPRNATTPFPGPFHRVQLPRLSVASFKGSCRALAFTQNLDIPETAELSFEAYHPIDIPLLMDVIGPRLRDAGVNCFSYSPGLRSDNIAASAYGSEAGPSPRIFTTASHDIVPLESSLALFHQILMHSDPDRIVSLHVDPYVPKSMGPLEELLISIANNLQVLSALTTFSVACVPMAREWPFLEALRGPSNADMPNFAPALQVLVIFSDDTLVDRNRTKTEVDCVRHRWDKIVSILEHRLNIGLPLHRLVLEGERGDDPGVVLANVSGRDRAVMLVDEVVDNRRDHASWVES